MRVTSITVACAATHSSSVIGLSLRRWLHGKSNWRQHSLPEPSLPNEADVERAIRGPIRRYNERYRANAAPVEIEDPLVEKVIRDLRESGGRSGAEETGKSSAQIELPYLQLTMTKLWDAEGSRSATKLRLDTLTQKLGGVQQIMRKHVDDVLRALPETDTKRSAPTSSAIFSPGHWRK
jgi:hypothetical protein